MPRVSLLFFKTGTIFLVIGVAMGLHMGISQNHSAMPAHAHINLLGWVTCALFAGYYACSRARPTGGSPWLTLSSTCWE